MSGHQLPPCQRTRTLERSGVTAATEPNGNLHLNAPLVGAEELVCVCVCVFPYTPFCVSKKSRARRIFQFLEMASLEVFVAA